MKIEKRFDGIKYEFLTCLCRSKLLKNARKLVLLLFMFRQVDIIKMCSRRVLPNIFVTFSSNCMISWDKAYQRKMWEDSKVSHLDILILEDYIYLSSLIYNLFYV